MFIFLKFLKFDKHNSKMKHQNTEPATTFQPRGREKQGPNETDNYAYYSGKKSYED